MDEARKKTTKELQEETKAILEQGKRLEKESDKSLERMRLLAESERIEFNRYKPINSHHWPAR